MTTSPSRRGSDAALFISCNLLDEVDDATPELGVVYYYGYWFDYGVDDWYYWFPADVVIVDETWVEYTA